MPLSNVRRTPRVTNWYIPYNRAPTNAKTARRTRDEPLKLIEERPLTLRQLLFLVVGLFGVDRPHVLFRRFTGFNIVHGFNSGGH